MYKELIYLVIDGNNTSIIALWVTGIRRGLEDYSPLTCRERPLSIPSSVDYNSVHCLKKTRFFLGKGDNLAISAYQIQSPTHPPTHPHFKHYFFNHCRSECPVNRFDHCWGTTYPMDNLKQISHLLTFRLVERNC